MSDFTPADFAEMCLTPLQNFTETERIAALQAMQRLVQAELARLWARAASPGHAWTWHEGDERKSER
jgi:hypothetical protein